MSSNIIHKIYSWALLSFSFLMPLFSILLLIVVGFFIGGIILFIMGYDPIEAYGVMVHGVFGRPRFISYTIIYATPLILTGLSLVFAFKAGLFNIGAEGQFIIGALAATLAGIFIELPAILLIPIAIIIAILAGAAWGGLAGLLKVKFGINEVISTIMLNWIALYLSNFIVTREWLARPNSESSYRIQDDARIEFFPVWKTSDAGLDWREQNEFWSDILRTPANAGIFLAIASVIIVSLILNRTTLGFKAKSVGYSPAAARYAGINVSKYSFLAMAISGALAGLAGAIHVLGNSRGISILKVMEGYGFEGIVVGLLGNATPWGTFFAGLFYGGLKYGGSKIQPIMGAPTEIISIIIGIIVLLLSIPFIAKLFASYQKKIKAKADA